MKVKPDLDNKSMADFFRVSITMETNSNMHIGKKIDSPESLIFQLKLASQMKLVPRSNYKASISKGVREICTKSSSIITFSHNNNFTIM